MENSFTEQNNIKIRTGIDGTKYHSVPFPIFDNPYYNTNSNSKTRSYIATIYPLTIEEVTNQIENKDIMRLEYKISNNFWYKTLEINK